MPAMWSYLACCDVAQWVALVTRGREKWSENREEDAIFVAVLDGSDQFAKAHGEERARKKEEIHRRTCRRKVESHGGTIMEQLESGPRFRDAVFARFSGPEAIYFALATALEINRFLGLWNEEHWALWQEQVHTRIAISKGPWPEVVGSVQQAQSKEIMISEKDWNNLSSRERLLLRAAVSIRQSVPPESWEELWQEARNGIARLELNESLVI